MTDDFMGPPWQADWVEAASAYRDALPEEVRKKIRDGMADLVTARNPYVPQDELPEGFFLEPARSSRPKGPHILSFDRGRGWLRFTFVPRVEDPQIVVEEIFWQ
ncbi:hypothetical protein [Streptomyces sp. NBC_00354]|uniref:hypothetical protein n=1 Tax=Streptomyces sp. NBC_00354 TaxID=2975723 RepID=UPI00225545C0|nr:hypothetical protein [Streptomyces sp. NBC_00354]WSW45589.1 hypothetical protein OG296_22130 [Streptomyces sp. NBC_01001]